MRSDTVFGSPVHLICSDLYLKTTARRPDQRRVKTLVHIGLGHGDVILKTPGNGLVHLMYDTECGVTVGYRIDDYPDRKQVIYLVERLILVEHLAVYRHEMLDPAVKRCFNTGIFYMLCNIGDYLGNVFLTL